MVKRVSKYFFVCALAVASTGCVPVLPAAKYRENKLPETFSEPSTGKSSATLSWRDYFNDVALSALIDTALNRNQELGILMSEVEILRHEARAKKGEYLPKVDLGLGVSAEKAGKFTREGAVEEQLSIRDHEPFPEPLGDFNVGAIASWEVDIWKRLRNSRSAVMQRYLAAEEGRNLAITVLVSEIASTYYEIIALDKQLSVLRTNAELQLNALNTIKQEKEAARVTELAVKRFEAQYYRTLNLQYSVEMEIVASENYMRQLVGDIYNPVSRSSEFIAMDSILLGTPSELLANRPDIRKAALEMNAAGLEVDVARASFYPALGVTAGLGFRSYTPLLLLNPESAAYALAGEMLAPLVNRNGIKANYFISGEKRTQAALRYQQLLLASYLEVLGAYRRLELYSQSLSAKQREANILSEAVSVSINLYKTAHADYLEVLLTQREALDTKMEVIEVELERMKTNIGLYRALGGGWN